MQSEKKIFHMKYFMRENCLLFQNIDLRHKYNLYCLVGFFMENVIFVIYIRFRVLFTQFIILHYFK